MFDLHGRKILVTGASRGIGRAIATAFAEQGALVACLGRDARAVNETVDRIRAGGGAALPIIADLGSDEALRSSFHASLAALGGLDVLVNNAGVAGEEPALELQIADWDRIHRTNLRAPFMLAQLAGRVFAPQRHGKVINVGSIASHVGWAGDTAYIAAKHGLLGLTRALAIEWASLGIQVNLLSPGYFRTEMTADMTSGEANDWVTSMTPMGRWGEVDELTGAAVFLASPASDFMTGQSLVLDGGWSAR